MSLDSNPNEEKPIFNPLKNDFTVNYDIDGNLNPKPFTAKSFEFTYFKEPIYSHIKRALVEAIIHYRNINPILEEPRRQIELEVMGEDHE